MRQRFDLGVRLLHCRSRGGSRKRITRLFELVVPAEQSEGLAGFLEQWLPPGSVWERLGGSAGTYLVWTTEASSGTCRWTRRTGAICLTCPIATPLDENGHARWTVLVRSDNRAVGHQVAVGHFGGPTSRARSGRPDVEAVHRYTDDWLLSPGQERAMAVAVQLGYFEFPRRAGLRAVAQALGVRPSTAQEHLRRGLGKIIAQRGRPDAYPA